MRLLYCLLLIMSLSGCSSLKDATANYVEDAVRQKLVHEIDDVLEKRGLNLHTLKLITDSNKDGSISKSEILTSVKEATKDYTLLETKNYIDKKIVDNEKHMATQSDVEKHSTQLINYILALVSAYLGKQIWSAKRDGKRDERIAILEKLLNKDLDQDGVIGEQNSNNNAPPTAIS